MCSRRALFVVAVALVAPACAGPSPVLCGEGEGEDALFGPTLDGVAAPADFGTLPLNGILHVAVRNQGAPVTASLRTVGGSAAERPVDLDEVGPVMRFLLGELVADTGYVLTLRMDPADAADGAQIVRELSFTTTDIVDDTPPVFAGEPTIDVVRSVDGVECSGPGTLVNVISPEVSDGSGVAGVEMFAVDNAGGRTLAAFGLGSGRVLVDTRETGIDVAYELVAVDVAGNESEPRSVDVNVESSGCSASVGSPAFVVFVLLLRRPRAPFARGAGPPCQGNRAWLARSVSLRASGGAGCGRATPRAPRACRRRRGRG